MTPSTEPVEAVRQTTLLGWMEEVRAAARSGPWAPLLDFEGVDALDVLLSPIYLSLLSATRAGTARDSMARTRAVGRMRQWAYQAKTAIRERMAARKSAPAGPTGILFWSRDITHTTTMEVVAAAATELGERCRLLACQPNIFAGLQHYVPDAVYTAGAWPGVVHRARREGARARGAQSFGPWELPAPPPGSPAGLEGVLRATVVRHLPLAAEAIANARTALDDFRPRVLVVGNDLTVEGRAGCRVAATRGVPTATFMHGSISGDALQALHCADCMLVYADSHRRVLIGHGLAPQRVVVCGAPHLDRRPTQSGQVHPKLQERLGLRPSDPWILVATSGPGHRISHSHHREVIEHLAELSRALPEVPVVVKLHRKDRAEYYASAIKHAAPHRLIVVPDSTSGLPGDIFDWLQGCRVVLTGASTVATEAMLMGVDVVTMDFCGEIHGVDFIDAGATAHVRTGEALVEAVREALVGRPSETRRSRVQSYLEEAYSTLDGRAAERGAEALRVLAQRRGSP